MAGRWPWRPGQPPPTVADPFTGETFAVEATEAWRATPGPPPASTCRCPIPGQPPWRLCMRPTAHAGGCLPVPSGRGLAVR